MYEQGLDTIKPVFDQARKDLYYPPIAQLERVRNATIEITFRSPRFKLLVGEGLTEKFSQEALRGLFHHELNHWAKHPYDVGTLILEHYWLGEVAGKNEIRNLYDDVVVNLDLVINRGLTQVAQAYCELPATIRVDRLLRLFYFRVTGIDFGGGEVEAALEQRIGDLCSIDFLDLSRVRLRSNIRRFAEIIGDLLGESMELPYFFFSPADFSPERISRAVAAIAQELPPQEYREMALEILNNLKEAGMVPSEPRSGGTGISPGHNVLLQALDRPDVGWYRSKCRSYSIFIEPLIKKGSLYPEQITDFNLDDNIDTFSAVESYGKVLPSLARKYELAEYERYGEISVPDAVIIIDSSGSMPNPEEVVSYAVLGAFSVARSYFELGAKVGVINFSDVNMELGLTADRQRVYEMLKVYQGHGTTLHVDSLDQYVQNLAGIVIDYILITDAGIDNILGVVDYFSTVKGRLTIIWLKSETQCDYRFRENYELLKRKLSASARLVEIENERDIPRIAIGKTICKSYGIN